VFFGVYRTGLDDELVAGAVTKIGIYPFGQFIFFNGLRSFVPRFIPCTLKAANPTQWVIEPAA